MNSHQSTTVVTSDDQRPSMAIVELISQATGTNPIELEPLYNVIDPDVLDSLCTSSSGFSSLEFEYAGRTVAVEQTTDGVEISLATVTIGAAGTTADSESEPTVSE
ncbi:hypothetical protein SAMN04487967_1116 [Natronorubrum sediminis]|uniref:Halobacterial output domain-containing protein n=1 Tax=Natronorubrum sediminis TaxID=640943 RepID=A0A1H6FQ73_9EURY|nr:HalOD1 output domain-containing protein [Natronorubrum sediminis]SEH13051.1 hypothetical protein SAMN04487967_1116 [Natronorubrum sediminis]